MIQGDRAHAHDGLSRTRLRLWRVFIAQDFGTSVLVEPNGLHRATEATDGFPTEATEDTDGFTTEATEDTDAFTTEATEGTECFITEDAYEGLKTAGSPRLSVASDEAIRA